MKNKNILYTKTHTLKNWNDTGLLEGMSILHKNDIIKYYNKLSQLSKHFNNELIDYYLPCLRRIYEALIIENLTEDVIILDIMDIIIYINNNFNKTIKGISHLNYIDTEAETCRMICYNYIFRISKIYKDYSLREQYLRNIKIDEFIN